MKRQAYQHPELRDENDNIIQQGAFGKNTALANSTNDGWIDYVANDLEALYDNINGIKKWMADHDITETGTVTLTNSLKFPFNNSKRSVSLSKTRKTTNYVVLTEVTAFNGNVGNVEVTGKLTNGFQIGYTGSAASATIKYVVIGGFGE